MAEKQPATCTPAERPWDVIVVGAGLVGSAAARHLAEAGARILILGPSEPVGPGRADVFASHYDQGRVQRLIGRDALWTRLNVRSAAAWPELEAQTGIQVLHPDGCLYLAPQPDDYLASAQALAREFGLPYAPVTGPRDITGISPELHVPEGVVGLFMAEPAGSINPRAVVRAQLDCAVSAGAMVLREVVTEVRRERGMMAVRTASGAVHRCPTVVVATGSFTNASRLLPAELDVDIKGETVVLAEVSPETAAELNTMPSLLYAVSTDRLDGIYAIKPLRYPDGRFHLKLGMNHCTDPDLREPDSLRRWFREPAPGHESLPELCEQAMTLFPTVPFLGFQAKRCVISRTVGRRPYLGLLDKGLVVAMGCNGYSAMASDEQGRIAASLAATGVVPSGYDGREIEVRTR